LYGINLSDTLNEETGARRRKGNHRLEKQAQTKFITGAYSAFWEKQVAAYGFTAYHQQLLDLLQSFKEVPGGSKVLEVGIGTGFPFACFLSEKGYEVHGVDLSDKLVQKCRSNYPSIQARVGDAEALPYDDKEFPLTYCLQSTWYFPHLALALSEMFRVTRKPGIVVFDIMNAISPMIICRHWIRTCFVERTAKAALNGLARAVGKTPRYDMHIHQSPANPFMVRRILERIVNRFGCTLAIPEKLTSASPFRPVDYLNPRLVFICRKE
jgi:ubiquinone/menaquinone biosynthesis C-methylase UbiE